MPVTKPCRETAAFAALAFGLAASALESCAEKPIPPSPAAKAQTAVLSATMGTYTDVDIHCLDGREVEALLGLKVASGPHRAVVSYSVCGVDRNCAGYMGEVGFSAAAGASYRIEGKLPVGATTAQLTVVNAKDGKPVAGPFPAARNVMGEDPKRHYNCAPKA